MSVVIRRNLSHLEERKYRNGLSESEMKAARLRIAFFKKYVLHFDTNLYQTQVERDWAYIAKREYNFEVLGRSLSYGFAWGNAAWALRMFAAKRFVFWPFPVVWALGTMYYLPINHLKHNKRLFDMLNVGEEYYLGRRRNEVLGECNRILDVEDF